MARSRFRSQNVQNTPCSDHFWRLQMSKKCTPLWREAHFEVKMYKTHPCSDHFWRLQMSNKCTPLCRRKQISKSKCTNTSASHHFWRFRCRITCRVVVAQSTFRSQNVQNTPFYGPHLEVQMSSRVAGARECTPTSTTEQNVRVLWHLHRNDG